MKTQFAVTRGFYTHVRKLAVTTTAIINTLRDCWELRNDAIGEPVGSYYRSGRNGYWVRDTLVSRDSEKGEYRSICQSRHVQYLRNALGDNWPTVVRNTGSVNVRVPAPWHHRTNWHEFFVILPIQICSPKTKVFLDKKLTCNIQKYYHIKYEYCKMIKLF